MHLLCNIMFKISLCLIFTKINRTFSLCLHSLVKAKRMFGRIPGQINENSRCSQEFSLARGFSSTLPQFSPGYEGTESMFYFFNKQKDKQKRTKLEQQFCFTKICMILKRPSLVCFYIYSIQLLSNETVKLIFHVHLFLPVFNIIFCAILVFSGTAFRVRAFNSFSKNVRKARKGRYIALLVYITQTLSIT